MHIFPRLSHRPKMALLAIIHKQFWGMSHFFLYYSGVSRRLRRLAGIETAFGHQNGPTRRPDDDDDHKSTPPHSWALNSKNEQLFISTSVHARSLKSSHVHPHESSILAHNLLKIMMTLNT